MTKIIVTLGPATNSLEKLLLIKSKSVDFVRINMSHSTVDDLKYFIALSKKVKIPFILDTEGSQVRTGILSSESVFFKENDVIRLYKDEIIGDLVGINLKPSEIIDQLHEGDILYVDFDTLVMRIINTSCIESGFIEAIVLSEGKLGNNKGIVIDPRVERKFTLPTLTKKDYEAIQIGLKTGVNYIAASFMRSRDAIKEVKKATGGKMKIISKVECKDALENLDEIIDESDYLLIDRGDLSKEIPIEKIPFTQKIILNRAKKAKKGVFVATNLLESMVLNRKPTRAEVNDIVNTIVDGAFGLTLSAETAIGEHPIGCINMLKKVINHAGLIKKFDEIRDKNKEEAFVSYLENHNYILDDSTSSSLTPPHGGSLINRTCVKADIQDLNSLQVIMLNENQQLDLEQIAIGTYSPIEGFMTKEELESVLDNLKLPNGLIWPIPILLDISEADSILIREGDTIALSDMKGEKIGIMNVEEKYSYDKAKIAQKIYYQTDINHPGVELVNLLKPIFLGGKIMLFKRKKVEYSRYSLTPKQTRRLFEEKNWTKVVGFHTRNVIHSAHEFIQFEALKRGNCDGMFIHPVVGKKKSGDYNSAYIIKSYEIMQNFYPENKILFGVFSTYSRYAGVREAIFTALCRKNFGCSHFVIGRDHTGVGNETNDTYNSKEVINFFKDLGIEIIKFNTVYYSKSSQKYIEDNKNKKVPEEDKMYISGTEARHLLKKHKCPPNWFMRPEISQFIVASLKNNEEVFIK